MVIIVPTTATTMDGMAQRIRRHNKPSMSRMKVSSISRSPYQNTALLSCLIYRRTVSFLITLLATRRHYSVLSELTSNSNGSHQKNHILQAYRLPAPLLVYTTASTSSSSSSNPLSRRGGFLNSKNHKKSRVEEVKHRQLLTDVSTKTGDSSVCSSRTTQTSSNHQIDKEGIMATESAHTSNIDNNNINNDLNESNKNENLILKSTSDNVDQNKNYTTDENDFDTNFSISDEIEEVNNFSFQSTIQNDKKVNLNASSIVTSNDKQQQKSAPGRRKSAVALTGFTLLSSCIVLAKMGLLPGSPLNIDAINNLNQAPSLFNEAYSVYNNQQIIHDSVLTIVTTILAYGFVKVNTYCVSIGLLEPRDARKIIHTFSAPLFILLWPFFDTTAVGSRYFAAIVPTLNAVRLYLAATANTNDEINYTSSIATTSVTRRGGEELELAVAVSRSGDVREALGGPFIYVVMLLFAVLLFWTDSPVGIVALSCMAAGDGMADLIGRRYGATNKWPIGDRKKSVAGSIAFVLSSTISSIVLLFWTQYWGCSSTIISEHSMMDIVSRVVFISVITAALEVIPFAEGLDDNYIVPISAVILSLLLF